MADDAAIKQRLASMLRQVASEDSLGRFDLEAVAQTESAVSGVETELLLESVGNGLDAIHQDREIRQDERFALEAIVMPRFRPVIDVVGDDFARPPEPWKHLGAGKAKQNLLDVLPSIGRIELPGHPSIPFGGTGFVVGDDLIMTNRHVAELFATGVGRQGLNFIPGSKSGIDFGQEVVERESLLLPVKTIAMIHPHWDMALLHVSGLTSKQKPLVMCTTPPEELLDRDIAVVGYPAQDRRNDFELQMKIFNKTFDVKRLQPGKIRKRELITDHFQNKVFTVTHDASTLGGNSGSAVIDVLTGEVLALHFGGRYLVANYAVPTFELARDKRVVDVGVNFANSVPASSDWDEKWNHADVAESRAAKSQGNTVSGTGHHLAIQAANGTATWSLPINVSVSIGAPVSSAVNCQTANKSHPAEPKNGGSRTNPLTIETEALKTPFIANDLHKRGGFDPTFLDTDEEIPMPLLTAAGKRIAAKLDNGKTELRYHKFSIVMHKKRRMALLTAANIDWRDGARRVDGRLPTRRELSGLNRGDAEKWVNDPRIPNSHQLPDVFYTKDRKSFDKGHIVRRHDICWGDSFEDIQMANGDTYHTTNCSPQVKGFNRSSLGEDNWGDLETLIQKQTKAEKAIVFAGPAFSKSDPVFTGRTDHGTEQIKIPQKYWKIVVTNGGDGPEAFGFVLEQDLGDVTWEMAVSQKWKKHMRTIADIEQLLDGKATFGDLSSFDQFGTAESLAMRTSLDQPAKEK